MKVGLSENFTNKITNALKENERNRKLMKEDNYESGIFFEIETALYEAGLQPSRFSDDGMLTNNLGWTVTSPETGETQQLECCGSWLSESSEEAIDGEFKVGDIVKVPYKYGSYTPGEFIEAPIIEIENGKFITVEIPSKLVLTADQLRKYNSGLSESLKEMEFPPKEEKEVTRDELLKKKEELKREYMEAKSKHDRYWPDLVAEDIIKIDRLIDGVEKEAIIRRTKYKLKESIDLSEEGFDTWNGFKNELRKAGGLYGLVSDEAHHMSTDLLKEIALNALYYAEGHEEEIAKDIKERYYDYY